MDTPETPSFSSSKYSHERSEDDEGGESFVVRKQYHPIKGEKKDNYHKARYQSTVESS